MCSSYAEIIDVSESSLESITYTPKRITGFGEDYPGTILLNDCPNLEKFSFLQNFTYPRGEVEIIDHGAITIDISNCTSLTKFSANNIESIKIDNCPLLKEFTCKGVFEHLGLSGNTGIEHIYIYGFALNSVDISSCKALKNLYCLGLYETIDLSENTNIDSLTLIAGLLTSLNTDALSNMRYMDIAVHSIGSDIILQKNSALKKNIIRDILDDYPFTHWESLYFNLNIKGLSSLKHIDFQSSYIKNLIVSDCPNLEYLTSQYSYSNYNQDIPITLTVKNCPSLRSLICSRKKLTSVEISECPNINTLDISSNSLTSFIADNGAKYINCSYNELTSLFINDNTELIELQCEYNKLQNLNLDGCSNLAIINCAYNNLSSIPADNHPKLRELFCNDNLLTSLDISENRLMDKIDCRDNQGLKQLFVSNSQVFSVFRISGNTEVVYK